MSDEMELAKQIQEEIVIVLKQSLIEGKPFLTYTELKNMTSRNIPKLGRKKMIEIIGVLKNKQIVTSYKICNRELYYLTDLINNYKLHHDQSARAR